MSASLYSWERGYVPDNKDHRQEAKDYEFYKKVLRPNTPERKLAHTPEFQSQWQEDMRALGRRPDLGQNLPWSDQFDIKFQDREDISGLVEAERLVPGSGLDVSLFSVCMNARRHPLTTPPRCSNDLALQEGQIWHSCTRAHDVAAISFIIRLLQLCRHLGF
jgi:hypothetical protein